MGHIPTLETHCRWTYPHLRYDLDEYGRDESILHTQIGVDIHTLHTGTYFLN